MIGATVTLYERSQAVSTDTPPVPLFDAMNDPVWAWKSVTVDNVLIGQPTAEEISSSVDLYGQKAEFMLGIPKGDEHAWENGRVEFFGETFRVIGPVIQGIEANVPTPWHKKVRVGRCE